MKTGLSLGAGVDTTAILRIPQVMDQVDFVVFSDTGGEHPETYQYIEHLIGPFLKEKGIPFHIVRGREVAYGVVVESLEEACMRWRIIPSRILRHCTAKFKLKPIREFIEEEYPNEEIRMILGIAADEPQRVNNNRWKGYTTWYPLIELKLKRSDCVMLIKESGWPVPIKSGCFYCPFQRLDQWKTLRWKHPELWNRAIALEKNGSAYPRMTISNFRKNGKPLTLEEVDRKLGSTLDEFDPVTEDSECGGVCEI